MEYLTLKFRVIVLILLIVLLFTLHFFINGGLDFLNPQENFIFYNLLFAVIMGLLLRERKFTTPTHSLANCLAILLALIIFKDKNSFLFYKFNIWFFTSLAIISILAIFSYDEDKQRKLFSELTYKLSTFFGKATWVFSIAFVFALFSFYRNKPIAFLLIATFWGIIIFSFSTNILILLQASLFGSGKNIFKNEFGRIIEESMPGLITFFPYLDSVIKNGDFCFMVRDNVLIYRVFRKFYSDNQAYCKGALIQELPLEKVNLGKDYKANKLYCIGDGEKLKLFIKDHDLLDLFNSYVGLACEQTDIDAIRFQVISEIKLEEGYILMTKIENKNILYQIVNVCLGLDKITESATAGVVIGIAQQVGEWNPDKVRFDKYGWIPKLYSPLYLIDKKFKVESTIKQNELILGYIPNTNFPIIANADTLVTHHTAILGITGSGKTEIAFTILSKMIECKTKVFCVDFTGDYLEEFKQFNPETITIPTAKAQELNQKLFEAEIGEYGAGKEKKALDAFKKDLIPDIEKRVKEFIESDKYLGIFELSEISNTSATVAVTELYISSLFKYARQNRNVNKKYCIVLEEAHTIIPEERTMGVEDKFSKATISKICQIALQGRKYKVGLMIIAQRTANVTKTVLNQCNSIIVFSSFDKTGFDFMENYIGRDMIQAVPNLKMLQAIVAGRAFKSGRPLIMAVPKKEKFQEAEIT